MQSLPPPTYHNVLGLCGSKWREQCSFESDPQKSAIRPRPAEKRLAHAYSDVTSTASKMAASLHPASRKRSTSAFSISPGLRVSLSAKRNSSMTLGSTGALG